MTNGLKIHLLTTLLYIILLFLMLDVSSVVDINGINCTIVYGSVNYITLVYGFVIQQIIVFFISYFEGWYEKHTL